MPVDHLVLLTLQAWCNHEGEENEPGEGAAVASASAPRAAPGALTTAATSCSVALLSPLALVFAALRVDTAPLIGFGQSIEIVLLLLASAVGSGKRLVLGTIVGWLPACKLEDVGALQATLFQKKNYAALCEMHGVAPLALQLDRGEEGTSAFLHLAVHPGLAGKVQPDPRAPMPTPITVMMIEPTIALSSPPSVEPGGGVFWVNADTEATLLKDYGRVAALLGVPEAHLESVKERAARETARDRTG